MVGSGVPSLSGKERVLLELLTTDTSGLYGLQLVERSDGAIGRGTVYVTLDRMEEKGLVESKEEQRAPGQSGIARRIYVATALGKRILAAHRAFERNLTRLRPVTG